MDYTTLITNGWKNSPKFNQLVSLLTACINNNTQIVNQFPTLFDVDVAVGDQLTKTGQWIGIGRDLNSPITNIWFEWDTPGLGWDQGYWQGQEIFSNALTSIPDPEYRAVLKAQIAISTIMETCSKKSETEKSRYPQPLILQCQKITDRQ